MNRYPNSVVSPYSGLLLLSHLAAFGLAELLTRAEIGASIHHDPDSPSCEPVVGFDCDDERVGEIVRDSALECETIVEADLEPGRTGNDRRPVIWARVGNDDRAEQATVLREKLVRVEERAERSIAQGVLAGLGAPATWGPDRQKPSVGASPLDAVIGNRTADLVRSVLRPARDTVADLPAREVADQLRRPDAGQPDKTGWAPQNVEASLPHQWLATVGLCLLPVSHRRFGRSQIPGFRRDGGGAIALPVIDRPISSDRMRAVLRLEQFINLDVDNQPFESSVALKGYGVQGAALFRRRFTGTPQSVSYSFEAAELIYFA